VTLGTDHKNKEVIHNVFVPSGPVPVGHKKIKKVIK